MKEKCKGTIPYQRTPKVLLDPWQTKRKEEGRIMGDKMTIRFLGTGAAEGIPAPFCRCTVCENARKVGG